MEVKFVILFSVFEIGIRGCQCLVWNPQTFGRRHAVTFETGRFTRSGSSLLLIIITWETIVHVKRGILNLVQPPPSPTPLFFLLFPTSGEVQIWEVSSHGKSTHRRLNRISSLIFLMSSIPLFALIGWFNWRHSRCTDVSAVLASWRRRSGGRSAVLKLLIRLPA